MLSRHLILEAMVAAEDGEGSVVPDVEVKLESIETKDYASHTVEQYLQFTLAQGHDDIQIVLRGVVYGSGEAFPAETRSTAQDCFAYVRNSVGLSHNLRNNAVYDCRWDGSLSGLADRRTCIKPKREQDKATSFSWISRGTSIELVFRSRFYQRHKGIEHFSPWTYRVWKGPLKGYCTWWAHEKMPEFFEKIDKTPGETLRRWDVAAREELDPDVYILACWGVHRRLNVAGLVDGWYHSYSDEDDCVGNSVFPVTCSPERGTKDTKSET